MGAKRKRQATTNGEDHKGKDEAGAADDERLVDAVEEEDEEEGSELMGELAGDEDEEEDEEDEEEESEGWIEEGSDDDDDNAEGIVPDSESDEEGGGAEDEGDEDEEKEGKQPAPPHNKGKGKQGDGDKGKGKGAKKEKGAKKGKGASGGVRRSVFGGMVDGNESDSSEDERIPKSAIGNVPREWYDDLPHIGYNIEGEKVGKDKAEMDALDELLSRQDDPNFSRTITDEVTGQTIQLTDRELDIVRRIRAAQFPHADYDDTDQPVVYFASDINIHPLSTAPPPKARFLPSKWEAKKILKLVRALREGHIKPVQKKATSMKDLYNFDIWDADSNPRSSRSEKVYAKMVAPPKLKLPGHAESYNPSPEYLYTEAERRAWEAMDKEDRPLQHLPTKYDALRLVPAYPNFVKERFERCLDLYLCPRVEKQKLNIDIESLIPKLPSPSTLRPFPSLLSLVFTGHTQRVRAISLDSRGEWLCSGSDDKSVRVWEVATGRCVHSLRVDGVVDHVAWNPNPAIPVIAVVTNGSVLLWSPGLGAPDHERRLRSVLFAPAPAVFKNRKGALVCQWSVAEEPLKEKGVLQVLTFGQVVKRVTWHQKGDYFATVAPKGLAMAVLVHRVSQRGSQKPFKKAVGHVECVLFHPSKPHFFVAGMRHVWVYNLMQQKRIKKISTGMKMVSCLAVHPGGDNIIVGSYDKRVAWFDLDMSSRAYKVLRFHSLAIRQVQFHPRLPLFASASDDATTHVFHARVYDDLNKDALIVPVKILRGHEPRSNLGVLDLQFHPTQPWLFSAGADHTIRAYISP